MPDVSLVVTALTVTASLSLVVERVLEVVNHIRDQDNAKTDAKQVTAQTNSTLSKARELITSLNSVLDAYQDAKTLSKQEKTALAAQISVPAVEPSQPPSSQLENEKNYDDFEKHSNITVLPVSTGANPLGQAQTALVLALFAAGMGIILAELFKLNLISLLLINANVPHWADITFTGIVIGGGSQPIHVLIRFLTTRKVPVMEVEQEIKPEAAKKVKEIITESRSRIAPTSADESYWQPILYDGGVKPETLDHAHLRSGDPNLVVYHHTAMASNIPFNGVVDEFLVNKGWLTGYHCVIMPDGTINPFCRWDRYGNHAKGLNDRSLGIAFHGNFHILADDRFSNNDGRFGFQKPTSAQLDAGARVVALWVHLYPDLDLDFDNDILPHNVAMPGHTVCPGSNFPHEEFKDKISFYYGKWEVSKVAQQEISLFSQKTYIYC